MTVIDLVIILLVIGVVVYLFRFVPMDPTVRTILIAVLAVVAIIWLLSFSGVGNLRIGR